MANFTFSSDLKDSALFSAGEPTDGTSEFDTQALEYLNNAYRGIWTGGGELDPNISEAWWWLRKDTQGVLTLNPVITTGTVSVANNSASITFSSGPTPSVSGRHFKVDGHPDVFIISAHTAGATAATLESVYTGTTDTTAAYKVFQLDYTLASDVLYLASPMRVYQNSQGKIPGIDLQTLCQKWPLNTVGSGVPRNFARTGEQSVRFSHYGGTTSTDFIKVDYEYARIPADLTDSGSEEPLVPKQFRHILSYWTAGMLLTEKDDGKATDLLALAKNGLKAMANENRRRIARQSGQFGYIHTRQEQIDHYLNTVYTDSGIIIP